MEKEILKGLGFTDIEVKVYWELLGLGASPAGRLAKTTGVYRKNLYDALERLMEKGLVTFVVENKRRAFQAKSPKNLLKYVEEKERALSERKKELEDAIPTMEERRLSAQEEIEAEIYRGNEGIKTILRECLEHREVLLIGATGEVEDRLPNFWPGYNKKREGLGCAWKLLLTYEARNRKITKSRHYFYKVLPKTLSGPNVIYIYGDSVANVLWLEKPVAFVVRHRELAESYKRYFHYLWNSL